MSLVNDTINDYSHVADTYFWSSDSDTLIGNIIILGRLFVVEPTGSSFSSIILPEQILARNNITEPYHFTGNGTHNSIPLPTLGVIGSIKLYEQGIKRYIKNSSSELNNSWFYEEVLTPDKLYIEGIIPKDVFILYAKYQVEYQKVIT